MLLIWAVVLLVAPAVHGHDKDSDHWCGHDMQHPATHVLQHVDYETSKLMNSVSWGPLRIYTDTSSLLTDFSGDQQRLATAQSLVGFVGQFFASVLKTRQVSGNLTISNTSTCGEITVPMNHAVYGLPNTDIVLYFSMKNSSVCSSGNYIAHAIHCLQDQQDRPLAGNINLCPSTNWAANLVESDSWGVQSTIQTLVHESTHVLGLSSALIPYYRDPSGNPYTPRDAAGHPVTDTTGAFAIPSQYKIQDTERGVAVTKYAFPISLSKARQWSGCPTLNGVEMESQWGASTAGSHIEKRVYSSDYMTGQTIVGVDSGNEISLAFLEDSGWYQVDYTYATNPPLGQNAGCGFMSSSCLSTPTGSNLVLPSIPAFCNGTNPDRCAAGRYARGYCGVTSPSNGATQVPAEYRYFNSAIPVNLTASQFEGGYVPLMDYCPTYLPFGTFSSTAGTNSDCRYASNTPSSNTHGETYGSSSRCFDHTLGSPSSASSSGCFSVNCQGDAQGNTQYSVTVNGGSIDCGAGGLNAAAPWFASGSLYCPPAAEVCPSGTSVGCLNGCSARGTCRVNANGPYCVCKPGFNGPDCSSSGFAFVVAGTVVSKSTGSVNGSTGTSPVIIIIAVVASLMMLIGCGVAAFFLRAGRPRKGKHQASVGPSPTSAVTMNIRNPAQASTIARPIAAVTATTARPATAA
ncbi:hypothetical protein SmJEL517_g01364 [Synchytrium microbalum]|uniref:EGF-like domain-containing protein n=1 Tax=Synchytrium microbalum TaxID=1806994 RepID=A0A507CGC7_9FUNG|nr:uncharacterized protein SmJEL517_g01364 [Synchytrium microbalum]TPX36665.1 hypothetical protein SmJEL517_g01364 [Synchytrium microbalum]